MTLSYANVDDTMVGYSVTGGTATAGTDYTAPAPGAVLTIPAGQKASTIAIATVDDEMEENPEDADADPEESGERDAGPGEVDGNGDDPGCPRAAAGDAPSVSG